MTPIAPLLFIAGILSAPAQGQLVHQRKGVAPDSAQATGQDANSRRRAAVEAEVEGRHDEGMMARLRGLQHGDLEQDRRELSRLAEERRGLEVTIRVPMPPEPDPAEPGTGLNEGQLLSCVAGRIATATDEIIVWDAASGARIGQPIPLQDEPFWVKLSPDGERLAVGSGAAVPLSIVHLNTGRMFPVEAPPETEWSVSWSPDGKWLVACLEVWNEEDQEAADIEAYLCDGFSGKRLRVLHATDSEVFEPTFSPDSAFLAIGGMCILRMSDGVQLDTKWRGPLEPSVYGSRIRSWRRNENVLDSITDDGALCCYDADKEQWRPTFLATSPYPRAMHHDAERARWIVAVEELPAMIVSERMADRPPQFDHDALYPTWSGFWGLSAISPDGRYIAEVARWDMVRVWDTVTGERLAPVLRHGQQQVRHLEFTASGRLLIASDDGLVRLWDCDALLPGIPPTRRGQRGYDWEDDGGEPGAKGVATECSYVLETLGPDRPPETVSKRFSPGGWVVLQSSPDGRFLGASGGDEEGLLVWDVPKGGSPVEVMPPGWRSEFTFDASSSWLIAKNGGQAEAWELVGDRRFQRPAITHTFGDENLQPSYPALGPPKPSAQPMLGPAQLTAMGPEYVWENATVEHQWGDDWVGVFLDGDGRHWFGAGGESLDLDELAQRHAHFEPTDWLVAPGVLVGVAKDSVALFRTPIGEDLGRHSIVSPPSASPLVRLGSHRLLIPTRAGIEVIDTASGKVTARYPSPPGLVTFVPLGDSDEVAIARAQYRVVALDLATSKVGKTLLSTAIDPTVEAPFKGDRRLVQMGSAIWSIDPGTGSAAELRSETKEDLTRIVVAAPANRLALQLDGLWIELRELETGALLKRVFAGIEGIEPAFHVDNQIAASFDPGRSYLRVGGSCSVRDDPAQRSADWLPGTFRVLDATTGDMLFSFTADGAQWSCSGTQLLAVLGDQRRIIDVPTGHTIMAFDLPESSWWRLGFDWENRMIYDHSPDNQIEAAWSLESGAPVPVGAPFWPAPPRRALPEPPPSWTPGQKAWWRDHGPSHGWIGGRIDLGPRGIVLVGTSLLQITPEGPIRVGRRKYPAAAVAHNDGSYMGGRLLDERRAIFGYRIDGDDLERTIVDFGPSTASPLEGRVDDLLAEWSRRLGLPVK